MSIGTTATGPRPAAPAPAPAPGASPEAAPGATDAARAARRLRRIGAAVSTASIGGLLLVWELLVRAGAIDRSILPSPLMVTGQLGKLLADGTLIHDIGVSTVRVLIGFFFSAAVAIPLGIALGASRVLKAVFDPIISIVRPLPSLSWIPLSILWLGIGEGQKYSIVFMGTFAPLLVFVTDATLRVDGLLVKAARNLGASRLRVTWEVLLPAALPSILSGLKVTLAISWACIISAEMVGAADGLGFLIWNGKDWGNIGQVIVGMLTISLTVVLLDLVFKALQSRLLPWQRSERGR